MPYTKHSSYNYGADRSIIPTQIRSESDYNVKTIVLKQVDRITYMLSIGRADTMGFNENYRALGFGVKSGLMSLEALISPFLKKGSAYYIKSKKVQRALTFLETNYSVNSRDFRYWSLLNLWLSLLVEELSHLGYFPSQIEELEFD